MERTRETIAFSHEAHLRITFGCMWQSGTSTHGILRTDDPAKSEILEAAAIVKQHSKSKDYARVGVEYIQVKYVKIVNDAGGAELKKRAKKVYV